MIGQKSTGSRSKSPSLEDVKSVVAAFEAAVKLAKDLDVEAVANNSFGARHSWIHVSAVVEGVSASKTVEVHNSDTF